MIRVAALRIALVAGFQQTPPLVDLSPRGTCEADGSGWSCWEGDLQLVASVRSVDPTRSADDVLRERFVLLGDWPRGRFGPAWAGEHLGWEAEVGDGTRTQVVRWWVVDGRLYTISAVGPADRLGPEIHAWVDDVRFHALDPR